jgi:branched-chain amino acid transport system permease protein
VSERARSALATAAPAVVLAFVVLVWWDIPLGYVVQGAVIGGLSALVALGISLVYRANRIVNFAAGELGALPATLSVLLVTSTVALGYFLAFAAGLVAAIVLGIVVETLLVRRFFRSPRLVLTVATIGIAQLLTGAAFLLVDEFELGGDAFSIPWHVEFTVDPIIFTGNDVVAMIGVAACFVALAVFLRNSTIGIAIRGGAESADRASTLGVPVRRLHTVVWVIATVLSFVALFLRTGIVGAQIGAVLGPAVLLRALAAAVIGRMTRLPTIAAAAIGLGIFEVAVQVHWNEPAYVDLLLFVVVLVALLLAQRPGRDRVDDEVSTWQAAREVRPIPRELASLPEVRYGRWAVLGIIGAVLLLLPVVLSEARINLAAAIVIFGIVALSLVVLTGWAGQVSLGQMAFVGIGAAVGGSVTARLGWDLIFGLVIAGLAGAVVAVLIGLPALRRRGLTLAVTSLGLALATATWVLNRSYFGEGAEYGWLPGIRIARPDLLGFIPIDTETRFYYLCLAGLLVALLMVHGVRHSRTGRALIALRENEHAAEAFGISPRITTLVAFAFSGFLAAFAGGLFVHHQTGLDVGFDGGIYAPAESLAVFSMAVIGGLGSAGGALVGAAYVKGVQYYLPSAWQYLATGAGLLLVLMILPGGLGAAVADGRDWLLRRVAARRGIVVPSLVADLRTEPPVPVPEAADVARVSEPVS